jgi:hypothetical protein
MCEDTKLTYSKDEILSVLVKINFILLSLHKIGSCYNEIDLKTYEHWTTEFIDRNRVTAMLAEIREVLSSQFSNDLGADDMSELERVMEGLECWQRPNSDNP